MCPKPLRGEPCSSLDDTLSYPDEWQLLLPSGGIGQDY